MTKQVSERIKEYKKRYYKENCRVFPLKLNKKKDSDVINILERKRNRTQYIKTLVREDIKKGKEGKSHE